MMKLIKGDCLAEMDKLIAKGVQVDAIITDPPYGTTACKWDSVIPFDAMWERLNKLIKPNGAIVLFGSEPFSSALRMSNIKHYKYDWIWKKSHPSNFVMAKKQPMRNSENISVFYQKQCLYNFIKEPRECSDASMKRWTYAKNKNAADGIGKNQIQGGIKAVSHKNIDPLMRYPTTIKHFHSVNRKDLFHPTQKPVALMEYLIKTYTNENETVLDFTMGSGSTGVACKNTNRNFIGIENNDKYFEIVKARCSE